MNHEGLFPQKVRKATKYHKTDDGGPRKYYKVIRLNRNTQPDDTGAVQRKQHFIMFSLFPVNQ